MMRDGPDPAGFEESRIDPSEQLLYRGTTKGWPGNSQLRKLRITCTTTDPLVATLFAIECRNHGQPVIIIASRGPFMHSPVPENWFAVIESAINVGVSPEEFASKATFTVGLDRAIEVLERLGYHDLPQRITGKIALRDALEESYHAGLRLSLEQIDEFNRLIVEVPQ